MELVGYRKCPVIYTVFTDMGTVRDRVLSQGKAWAGWALWADVWVAR